MKINLCVLVFLTLFCSCSTSSVQDNPMKQTWDKNAREQALSNINDPATWDAEMLEQDKEVSKLGDMGPFELGAFPVPKYDLVGKGSFGGVGNIGATFNLKGKNLLMSSFYIGSNELNKNRLKNKKDEVFFQIIVLTDTIDNENYSHTNNIVISRNHPDYLGQGFVKTKYNRIDFTAFQTAENNAYAIVNARLFNLENGKTILIAPQKDNTLRSLQLKLMDVTSETIEAYTEKLIQEKQVADFFLKDGNL